ncbi:MAG: isoprenylcysteine carboxylmethyltransferase family protein [Vicinamibacterales bacterium]
MANDTSSRGPGAPLPPTLVYIAGLVVGWWLDGHQALPIDRNGPQITQAVIGWIAVGVGLLLFVWGLRTFAHARTGIMLQHPARRVVQAGPYRWSRNPQYVGFTAAYIGAALLLNSAWPLLLLPVVVLTLLAAVIAREERYMRATFGPAYEEYCQQVRRWL